MIIYKVNGKETTKSLTEWFFGQKFVATHTEAARRQLKKNGKAEYKIFKQGTGFLTICKKDTTTPIIYKVNGVDSEQSSAEWYFGKKFVEDSTTSAQQQKRLTGKKEFKFWQKGTGYLTITLNK